MKEFPLLISILKVRLEFKKMFLFVLHNLIENPFLFVKVFKCNIIGQKRITNIISSIRPLKSLLSIQYFSLQNKSG